MKETLTISRPSDARTSEDFSALRKAGLAYIEALGSDLWTDYNLHDPGITILEALCYGITDLAYRTNYEIKDILALSPDEGYFHTAAEILTVNPVTINDYRKLVIDVDGVRNSWMLPWDENEVPIYVNQDDSELIYDQPDASFQQLTLGGLYRVLVEFEDDLEFGDLNDPLLDWETDFDGDEVPLEFIMQSWSDVLSSFPEPTCFATAPDPADFDVYREKIENWIRYGTNTSVALPAEWICFEETEERYRIRVSITYDASIPGTISDPDFDAGCYEDGVIPTEADCKGMGENLPDLTPSAETLQTGETFDLEFWLRFDEVRLSDIEGDIQDIITDTDPKSFIRFYQEKLRRTLEIVDHVRCTLMEHRNLCEDYLDIESLKSEEIVVCADIQIESTAVPNEVMAEILYQLENFITPPISWYTLQEMLAKGKKVDEIFNGPVLAHGFIDNDELDEAILRTELRTSDLINIIMDIPGVIAVKEFVIGNVVDGVIVSEGEQWVLPLKGDGLHVPKLAMDRSKILFFKDILPYRANMDRVDELLAEMRAKNSRGRLMDIDLDIAIPEGEDQEIETYFSIQNNFPLTYGIGPDGVPGNPNDLRRAQAAQLKAFILFFDQILANYMSQLGHVKDLFSMDTDHLMDPDTCEFDPERIQTYYSQAVTDIRGIEDLYVDHNNVDMFKLVADFLAGISETKEAREERKNRFLDHLVARFAESFSEYAMLMYSLRDDAAPAELVQDKLEFLNDYPEISMDRMKAFNYRPKVDCLYCNPYELWNTRENVSGFKKRVSRMLGIEDYYRRNLTCHCFDVQEMISAIPDEPNTWVWYLKDCGYTDPIGETEVENFTGIYLRSIEYDTETAARAAITYGIILIEEGYLVEGPIEDIYQCCDRIGGTVGSTDSRVLLTNDCGDVLACGEPFTDAQDVTDAYITILEYVFDKCTIEGMHVVEHILLRPKYTYEALNDDGVLTTYGDKLMEICLDQELLPGDGAAGSAEASTRYSKLYYEMYTDVAGEWRFRARTGEGKIVLRSEGYQKLSGAQHGMKTTENLRTQYDAYSLKPTRDGRYYFNLVADNNEIVATSLFYNTPEDRARIMSGLICEKPDEDETDTSHDWCIEDADPYSFRISVFLPSWAGRFRDINFRQLVEKTIRLECPAHISPKICWIGRDQMAEFECAYLEWLQANGACDATPASVNPYLDALIEVMNNLENVYPVATLHDCDSAGDGDGQVVLNYTSLGTL